MPLPQTFSLLVLGQGATGLSVVEWALAHSPERVTSITVYGGAASKPTERTRALEARGVHFVYGTEDVEGDYGICVASPGISEFSGFFASAAAHAGEIMGEPELAYRVSRAQWCAITGTNGKTTTTSLLNHLLGTAGLESVAVGNIGVPAIEEADLHGADAWFAAELSSYQIATSAELHPRCAVLLNITPDHLAWHRTHENYAAAKIKLFANMGEDDLIIVDVEDEGVMTHADAIFTPGRRVLSLGLADAGGVDAAFVRDGELIVRLAGAERTLVPVSDLAIAGSHNVINALAASAAALVSSDAFTLPAAVFVFTAVSFFLAALDFFAMISIPRILVYLYEMPLICLIFSVEYRLGHACFSQRRTVVQLAGRCLTVHRILFESFDLDVIHSHICMFLDSYHLHEDLSLILGDEFPRALVICLRIGKPVVKSSLYKRGELLILCDLSADLRLLFLAQLI